jgi:glutamate 5-kinase
MFNDNDELSGLVASMMKAEALLILSNIDGIFNGSPSDPNSKVIREIHKGQNISDFIQSSKSTFGRGGMQTKTNIAQKIADEGIDVFIANGKKDNMIVQLMRNDKDVVYTHFIASKTEVSSVKKWIAHSDDFAKGEIHINKNAEAALLGEKAVSLLPIGVISISGVFEKDEIVKVINEEGKMIAVGKTQYNSDKAQQIIGKKNQRPIIHCDYLYLE